MTPHLDFIAGSDEDQGWVDPFIKKNRKKSTNNQLPVNHSQEQVCLECKSGLPLCQEKTLRNAVIMCLEIMYVRYHSKVKMRGMKKLAAKPVDLVDFSGAISVQLGWKGWKNLLCMDRMLSPS